MLKRSSPWALEYSRVRVKDAPSRNLLQRFVFVSPSPFGLPRMECVTEIWNRIFRGLRKTRTPKTGREKKSEIQFLGVFGRPDDWKYASKYSGRKFWTQFVAVFGRPEHLKPAVKKIQTAFFDTLRKTGGSLKTITPIERGVNIRLNWNENEMKWDNWNMMDTVLWLACR